MRAPHPVLVLEDRATWTDLRTYLERARLLDKAGGVRLVADGTVLAAYVAPRRGTDLSGAGTVLGLRVAALAEPARVDLTVWIAGVLDRLARSGESTELSLPPVVMDAPWAGLSPPRSGWTPTPDRNPGTDLESVAATLGFNDGSPPRVFEVGRWTRFSWAGGHLLAR